MRKVIFCLGLFSAGSLLYGVAVAQEKVPKSQVGVAGIVPSECDAVAEATSVGRLRAVPLAYYKFIRGFWQDRQRPTSARVIGATRKDGKGGAAQPIGSNRL